MLQVLKAPAHQPAPALTGLAGILVDGPDDANVAWVGRCHRGRQGMEAVRHHAGAPAAKRRAVSGAGWLARPALARRLQCLGMILPTPGANNASRLFGWATPPDGAGPIGPDGAWPIAVDAKFSDVMRGLNPLHHLPVIGTIYRAITGETIPATMRVVGAGLVGGPLGMLGAGLFGLIEELIRMGPDNSRPPTPAGMSETGSERPMDPMTPGTLAPGAYLTLATTLPEFLEPTRLAQGVVPGSTPDPSRGLAAYASAMQEWRAGQAFEKGLS